MNTRISDQKKKGAERTRVEHGCISWRIYRDDQEGHAIMIEELWRSQKEVERC